MRRSRAIIACLVIVVILVGFPYAYFNKVNAFNQTKSELESMGYQVIDTPSNIHFSTTETFIVANLTAFVSVAKQYQEWGSTTIYQQGYSFYILAPFYLTIGEAEAVEYTPCNSIWWIWSF
jgi:hypothetical protein